jgi:1,4-alpha-glucan branching enzyme
MEKSLEKVIYFDQPRGLFTNHRMQKEVDIMAGTIKKNVIKRRSIEFVLEMPKAQKVILMDDFNQWDPNTNPMLRDKNGVWRETVMISPGRYEYRFWVDGEWYNDPRNPRRCPNCFGSENNVIEVM